MARLSIPDEQTYATFTATAQTVFPISFALLTGKPDLRVKVDGVELSQSDFTFSGTVLDGGGYYGGTVTLNTAATGDVVIWRDVTPERASQFASANVVPVGSVDLALNRAMALAQDARRDVGRALLADFGANVPAPEDVIAAATAVANKLDASLPATSPAVDASPYSANVILDKPHIPERFGATPAMLNGLADATAVIQRMLDATQQAEKDKLKPVEFGPGTFVFDGPAVIDLGNYDGSVLSIRGASNNGTRLLADRLNAEGGIKIVRPFNMEHVDIRDVALCSTLTQDPDVIPDADFSAARHNNRLIWITTDLVPGAPGYGVQQDISVRLSNIHVHGIGPNSGEAHYVGVWGEAPIRIDYAWYPQIYNLHLRGIFWREFEACVFGNNQHGLLMNHCYAPEIVNPLIEGYWDRAIANIGKEVGATDAEKFALRWEGGRVIGGIIAGANDGIYLSHAYGPKTTLKSPGFHVIGTHLNNRRFNFRSNGHRQIVGSGVQMHTQYLPAPKIGLANPVETHLGSGFYDPATVEPLPAAWYIDDGGDFDDTGSQYLEPGRYVSDNDAYCFYRFENEVTGAKVTAPRLNAGGIAVRVGAGQLSRSIQVTQPQRGGVRIESGEYAWAALKDVAGPGASKVAWAELEQTLSDKHTITSRTADINQSPVHALRRHRPDYAAPADGTLGYYSFEALNTAGSPITTMVMQSKWLNSTAGAEASGFDLFALFGGALTNFLSYGSGIMNVTANQATLTSNSANTNARPKDNNLRLRSDYATVSNGKLGSYAFQGQNSMGGVVEVAGLEASFIDNAETGVTTQLQAYGRKAGSIVFPYTLVGDEMIIPKLRTGSVVLQGGLTPVGYVTLMDTVGNSYRVMVA